MSAKISIITVVYNNKDFIEEAIRSVLSQDYGNLEYIIIDGGSTDGTLDIINKYNNQISIVISEKDNGLYDAMNKAYELASGDIVGILNSDDLFFSKDCISKVASAFETFSDADIVYGDLIYVKREDISFTVRHWNSGDYYNNYFLDGFTPAHPSVYVRRHVIEEHKYDLSYKLTADYDWLLRIFEKYKAKYIQEIIVKMRLGGVTNNSYKNIIRGNLEIAKSWKKNKGKYSLITLLYKRPKNKFEQFKKRIL